MWLKKWVMEGSSHTVLSAVVTSQETLDTWQRESASHVKICFTDSFDTALQAVITSQMFIGYFLL